ncbi:hypothetical protein GW17_00003175 [Ensete ventricosum]|nr:hypothetical protein GW17_00003175 [Ensete ventricosum]
MGLITHNRIYACIGTSPCPVIVDLVIIGFVRSSHHHAIISKGCPNPCFPSTPLPPLLPLRRWRLPLPVGNRPAKGRPPLWLASSPLLAVGMAMGDSPLRAPYSRLCPRAAVAPTGDASTRRQRPYGLLPLRATVAP